MPLSAQKKKQIMNDHKSGKMTVKSILEKHKIAKATFYNLKKKQATEAEPEVKNVQLVQPEYDAGSDDDYIEISDTEPQPQPEPEPQPKKVRSRTFKMDPKESGLSKLNAEEFPPEEAEQEEYNYEPAYQQENNPRYDQALPPNIQNTFNLAAVFR
jgi:hypothetical protein